MNQLIIGLFKSSTVDASARRKLHRSIMRRALCQTLSNHFDFFGRCATCADAALPTAVEELEGRESKANRRDASIGRRRQRA
jgi:hypothetical protein